MTDPPELDRAALQPLLDAEKACPDPPPEAAARVAARLSASLGLPPGALDSAPAPPASAPGPPPAGLLGRAATVAWGRGIFTFLVGAAVGVATYATVRHLLTSPPETAGPAAVASARAPVPASPVVPQPPAELAPPPAAAIEPVRASEPSPGDMRDRTLAAERQLLELARADLVRGQTDRALGALRRHARVFPHGRLSEERESLLVQALVATGQFAQARRRAAEFAQRYPHSLFQPVVDECLRSIP